MKWLGGVLNPKKAFQMLAIVQIPAPAISVDQYPFVLEMKNPLRTEKVRWERTRGRTNIPVRVALQPRTC